MSVADKIAALFDALTPADVEALPPAERRRFADRCRHWAALAEPQAHASPKTGILAQLKDSARGE